MSTLICANEAVRQGYVDGRFGTVEGTHPWHPFVWSLLHSGAMVTPPPESPAVQATRRRLFDLAAIRRDAWRANWSMTNGRAALLCLPVIAAWIFVGLISGEHAWTLHRKLEARRHSAPHTKTNQVKESFHGAQPFMSHVRKRGLADFTCPPPDQERQDYPGSGAYGVPEGMGLFAAF